MPANSSRHLALKPENASQGGNTELCALPKAHYISPAPNSNAFQFARSIARASYRPRLRKADPKLMNCQPYSSISYWLKSSSLALKSQGYEISLVYGVTWVPKGVVIWIWGWVDSFPCLGTAIL